ncbi:MAG TPA: HEAT repeat domain-containing protein [Kofleriaceae bacterium]|nr:HEAT repeat domain-containing protein [Kofleriaceae bacterium]
MRLGFAVLFALCVLVLGAAHARADNVDVLIKDLKSGSDYKVRLSAALSLAKLGDKRAIPGFVFALSDADKTVRGAAAVGLGKLVDASTSKAQRGQVIGALERMIAKESSDSVKKQAEKSVQIIKAIDADGGGGGSAAPATSVYVDIGPMSAKAEPAAKLKALMKRITEKTFGSKAKMMMIAWPTGKSPSRKDLDAKKVGGYHVDGTLTEVVVKEKGSAATVSCKVSMLIATFPEKSVFGFLNGGASVTASSDPKDIALATEDCLAAVVEDLVAKKIIPTIKIKAGIP